MPRANLTITLPDDVWIGELSRRFPGAVFKIRSARSTENLGVVLVELRGAGVSGVVDALESRPEIRDFEVFERGDGMALVQLEAANPFLLSPIEEAAVPLQLPFTIADGTVSWELITTRERLSTLADQLDAFGVAYDVDRVTPQVDFERILTDKQARVVQAALDRGYYDSPRTCTLTELADDLGMAASTCSETLHRAEERIIKRFDDESSGSRPVLEA